MEVLDPEVLKKLRAQATKTKKGKKKLYEK